MKKKENNIVVNEEIYAIPKSPRLFESYLEDRYITSFAIDDPIKREKQKAKLEKNAFYCLQNSIKDSSTRCFCEEFRMQDAEGVCKCGIYMKTLRDDESFKKMRNASLNRTVL